MPGTATLKRCVICGLQKPLAEFAAGALNLSSLSQVRKYSDICNLCQSKTRNRFKMTQFKNQFFGNDEEDEGGSRGKGSRLTLGANERIFATVRQIKAAERRAAIQKADRQRASTPAPGKK